MGLGTQLVLLVFLPRSEERDRGNNWSSRENVSCKQKKKAGGKAEAVLPDLRTNVLKPPRA